MIPKTYSHIYIYIYRVSQKKVSVICYTVKTGQGVSIK